LFQSKLTHGRCSPGKLVESVSAVSSQHRCLQTAIVTGDSADPVSTKWLSKLMALLGVTAYSRHGGGEGGGEGGGVGGGEGGDEGGGVPA
jgi:hypothetical protein